MAGETNHFDAVVCGSDPSGLIAAALLGRAGARVLLCGHDTTPMTFQAAGHTLLRAPGQLAPVESEPTARVLRRLNLYQPIRRRAAAVSPALQLRVRDLKVSFFASATPGVSLTDLTLSEGDQAPIEATIGRLRGTSAILDPLLASGISFPPKGFWHRREVNRVARRLPAPNEDLAEGLSPDHDFRVGLAATGALLSGFGPQDLSSVTLARTLDVASRGYFRLDEGTEPFENVLLEKLLTLPVDLRAHSTPAQLIERRGRVCQLRLKPRDEVVGLDHLIWAGAPSGLLDLLGDEPPARLREIVGAIRPSCYRYQLALLIKEGGIPPLFGPRLISVADPRRPPLEDNALLISVGVANPRNPGVVPVWVECLVPAPAVSAGPGYLTLVRGRVREQLRRLLPDWERHLIIMASPHDGLPPQGQNPDGSALETTEGLSWIPMSPAFSSELPRLCGVGAATPDVDLRNVYLAGRDVLPGLGLEGDFVTAWTVATQVSDRLGGRGRAKTQVILDG